MTGRLRLECWATPQRVVDFKWLLRRKSCDHDWQYDHEESQGPWTGYIERCSKCGAISQVPQ